MKTEFEIRVLEIDKEKMINKLEEKKVNIIKKDMYMI